MKCTIRRLLVYTVLITLISYTGFRLTTPVSFPASIPAANVGITRSEGVQAAGETRASTSELKVDDTSVVSTVSTVTRTDIVAKEPPSSPPPPQPAKPLAPPPPTPPLESAEKIVVKADVNVTDQADVNVTAKPEVNSTRTRAGGKPGKHVAPKSKLAHDNQLTEELVGRYAEDNVVMVTWANHHYHDFVRNWV